MSNPSHPGGSNLLDARSAAASDKAPLRVLLLESIHPSAHELFRAEGFHVEALDSALGEDDLTRRIGEYDVLGIRSKTRVTAKALANARRLITLGCFCIGTNQVDLGAANKVGIPVFNAPFSNTRSVAELVLCEIVMLSRRVADRLHEMHAGEWQKAAAGCYEVRDKTLGIVGYGHIGRQVGVLAEALGMHVLYFDILAKLPMGNNRPMRTLEELLKQSRFVTLHVPETPETRNMIGARELAVIPAGGYLLNASRGSVVDVGALAAALASGHLAGAAVDVFPEEPEGHSRTFATPLRGLANVVLTPHIGGSTSEAQEAIGREVAAALIRHLRSGATTGAVNFPHVDPAPARGERRLANVHKNVPGALRSINHVVSDYRANIAAQVLATDAEIGYVVMDLDQNVDGELKAAIDGLETSIRTRML